MTKVGAPKGSKNALGNKGGGRKSAYDEMADAQVLTDIWEGKFTKKELEDLVRSGKYGAKHIFAAKCMSGDERMLSKLLDKLFANKHHVEGELGIKMDLIEQRVKALRQIAENEPTYNYANGETHQNPRDG